MIGSQSEAKQFFVRKVVAQAQLEGVPLSADEQQMLSWSESDPDYVVDPDLPERLASEISDAEYERKIGGLLARSFAAEVARDPESGVRWKEVARVLAEGDHYILVMLDQTLSSAAKRWWQFWR